MNPYKFYLGIGLVLLGFAGLFFEVTKNMSAFLMGFGTVTAVYGANERGKE